MMRKNHDGSWTIGKREALILMFCGSLIGSAVTVGWTAQAVYAQVNSKAPQVVVDSLGRQVNRNTASLIVLETITKESAQNVSSLVAFACTIATTEQIKLSQMRCGR